jgi:hypothetical protein
MAQKFYNPIEAALRSLSHAGVTCITLQRKYFRD